MIPGVSRVELNAPPSRVQLGSGKYELSVRPLSDEDWAALEQWVQAKYVRDTRARCHTLEMSEEETQRQIDRAFDKASTLTLATHEGMRLLQSFEGSVYFSWLHCRRDHPDLTLDGMAKVLSDPDVLLEMMGEVETVDRLSTPEDPKKKSKQRKKSLSKKQRHDGTVPKSTLDSPKSTGGLPVRSGNLHPGSNSSTLETPPVTTKGVIPEDRPGSGDVTPSV